MKLTQAQLVVPRAMANSQAVGLAKHKATRTGVFQEYNPFDPDERTLLAREKANNWLDTPHDGACLFHALYASYRMAYWLPNAGLIVSGADMRTKICDYIRDNGALFQAQHSDMIRAKAALRLKKPIDAVTYEEALPVYCLIMRDEKEWGGYPEMDAAAMMLNVIVHEFKVPDLGGQRHTAILHATFYPIQSQLDNKAERKQVTKFVLIWRNNHFEYVAPDVPRALQGAMSTPSSSAEADVTVRERAQYMMNQRTKPDARKRSLGNDGLYAMALARESRKQQEKGGGKCPLYKATLTQEQRDEMATQVLIRQLQKEEEDTTSDAELARLLSMEQAHD